MSTKSPMSGLGGEQAFGRANFRLTVITIFAIHSAVLAGLLLQGCKRSASGPPVGSTGADTNLARVPAYELGVTTQAVQQTGQTGVVDTATGAVPGRVSTGLVVQTATPQPVAEPQPLPQQGQVGPIEYVVKAGDIPINIAREHGVSLSAFMKANPGLDPRRLKVGQVVIIPPPEQRERPSEGKKAQTKTEGEVIHVVKSGENLTRIARQYGVTVAEIRALNDLKSDRILVGQELRIPAPRSGQGTDGGSAAGGGRGGLVLPPSAAKGTE